MAASNKSLSEYDMTQILQKVFNSSDAGLSTSSFIAARVGNRVDVTYPTSSTEVYTFAETAGTLFALTVTYTDSTKANISSVVRTA